jgi:hypothetical protein
LSCCSCIIEPRIHLQGLCCDYFTACPIVSVSLCFLPPAHPHHCVRGRCCVEHSKLLPYYYVPYYHDAVPPSPLCSLCHCVTPPWPPLSALRKPTTTSALQLQTTTCDIRVVYAPASVLSAPTPVPLHVHGPMSLPRTSSCSARPPERSGRLCRVPPLYAQQPDRRVQGR